MDNRPGTEAVIEKHCHARPQIPIQAGDSKLEPQNGQHRWVEIHYKSNGASVMGPKSISRCALVVLFHGATSISDATCSFVTGLVPSASVPLEHSPDGNGVNAERAERQCETQFVIVFRVTMRAKEIKPIATSQLMQGGVLWIRAAVDSARNKDKVPLDSITCLARRMDQWSRRVKAKVC